MNVKTNHIFDLCVYVISVKSFTERHKSIDLQLRNIGFEYKFIFKNDPDDFCIEDLNKLETNKLSIGAQSCVLKHINAWEDFLLTKKKYALIIEDDVIFENNFLENLESIFNQMASLNSFLIFLGGADNRVDSRFYKSSELCLIEYPISTTEAYIVDVDSAKKRISWLQENKISLPADHLIKQIDSLLKITQHRTSFPLVSQGSLYGLFQTEIDSKRLKRNKYLLRLDYNLKKFRRRTLPGLIVKIFNRIKHH